MSRNESIEQIETLIYTYKRRLAVLKEQKAALGLHVPAHYITDIEDTEKKINTLQNDLRILENNNTYQFGEPLTFYSRADAP